MKVRVEKRDGERPIDLLCSQGLSIDHLVLSLSLGDCHRGFHAVFHTCFSNLMNNVLIAKFAFWKNQAVQGCS